MAEVDGRDSPGREEDFGDRWFSGTTTSSPPPMDTPEPLQDPLDPWGEAQVSGDGINGHTEGSWPNELRGGPRAGLGQSVWVHIEENGGFLSLGNL